MNITFIKRLAFTSIGRKAVMALTGLSLGCFMLVHLAENLLLFKGEVAYNNWVDFLLTNPITPLFEVGLASIFLAHIFFGVWVRIEDWTNAPSGYEARKWQGGRTIGSATMLYTAIMILAYLTYHMLTFKYTDHSMGFYQMVTSAFRGRLFTAIYIGGAVALVVHLSHGLQSAFQTLGVSHRKYTPLIKLGGWAAALLMVGFAMISLYFLLGFDLKAAEGVYQVVIP